MTVIRREGVTVQTDHPGLRRTFAMKVFSVGNWVFFGTLIYFILALAVPLVGEPGAPPLPLFIAFVAVFALIGILSVFWSGAVRRPWFWIVGALPATLMLVTNIPFIVHDVTRPGATPQFLVTVGAVGGGLATIIGGIVAFREVRRGEPAWTTSGRAGWVSIAAIGVAVGAVATSILAGLAPAGGGEITETPTVTGVLTAESTAFVEARLQMQDGEVLGLFVTNNDGISHSFDLDSLDIHVDLPANSTTAIAIKPAGPGTLEFFCAIPGHREAGMVGTIAVHA